MLGVSKKAWGVISLVLLFVATTGGFFWWWQGGASCIVTHYQRTRDLDSLIRVFAQDSYWLDARPMEKAVAAFANELDYVEHPEWTPTHGGPMQWRVARCGDETVGFVSFYEQGNAKARILYLGVDQRYRKRGLGRKLMLEAIRTLESSGIRDIIIATRIENFRAQNLYRQLGFVTTSNEGDFIFLERRL